MREFGRCGRQLSVTEHLEIRRRVAEGQTFAMAASAVGCSTKSIQRLIIRCGGLPPPARARSTLRLSCEEREKLSRGLRAGESLRAVAARLGRAPSTISREVVANGSRQRYRAHLAEKTAMRRVLTGPRRLLPAVRR
jgi:DNA-binding NarL/FixJ family response regulator